MLSNEKSLVKKRTYFTANFTGREIMCIAGHFLLQASFQDSNIIEYMLAALPFLMFGFVILAFKIASNSEDKEREEQSDKD